VLSIGKERKKSVLILTKPCGRLCNRLFQFSHLIAFCKHRDLRIVNLSFPEYAQYFNSSDERLIVSFPPCGCKLTNKFIRTYLQRAFRVLAFPIAYRMLRLPGIAAIGFSEETPNAVERLDSLLDRRLVFVDGWCFRDPDNFKRYADDIRNFFLPKEGYIRMAQDIHSKIRQDADVVIGLHIRRGDYKYWEGGKYYFEHEVYVRIIKDIVSQFADKRVKVLITGDESPNLEPYADVSDKIVWPRKGIIVDLMGLSYCDYIISVPSTFPMWASFYGKVPLFIITDLQQPIDFKKASIVDS